MKNVSNDSATGSFALTDHVLLLFNEHDTRIALNWESYTPKFTSRDGIRSGPEALKW